MQFTFGTTSMPRTGKALFSQHLGEEHEHFSNSYLLNNSENHTVLEIHNWEASFSKNNLSLKYS